MIKTFLLSLVLISCVDASGNFSQVSQEDDLATVQASINSNAELGAGVYTIDISSRPRNTSNIASLTVGDNQSLRGIGPATVIKFVGDAQTYDWWGVNMTGANPHVSNLTIDTTGLYNVQEQTHTIEVTGPSSNPVVQGVDFLHAPTAGTSTGGDCIKLTGFAATNKKITNALITDNMYIQCPRSGVDVHSGVYGMVVSDSAFINVAKVNFDSEEVNGDSDQWTLSGLTFFNGAGSSEIAISITTVPHVSISNTFILGRSIYAASATYLTMNGLVVLKTTPDAYAAVRIFKSSAHVLLTGSFLGRASTVNAPVVETMSDNGGYASHVVVSGNRISQGSTAVAVRSESATDYTIASNDIDCAACSIAVDIQGIIHRADRGLITGNRITGETLAGVRLTGANLGIGRTSVTNNISEGATQGLRCENIAGIVGPIVSGLNNWSPNAVACTLTAGN